MRNTGQDPISRSIPIVASAYARKFGIKIGIGGDEAFTDGDHIQLPSIPADYPYKDALWGFLAHEASHVRYTDFSVESPSDYHHSIANSIEDGRIETKFIREYPGAKETLDEALRLFVHQGKMQEPDSSEHPAQILSAYVLYWVRNQWRGQSILDKQFAAATNAIQATFPAGVVTNLDSILAEAPDLQSTKDVSNMVDRILKLFEDESPEDKPDDKKDQEPDKGDTDPNGDPGDSENSDSGDGQGDPEPDSKDQGGSSGDNSKSDNDQSGSSGGPGQKGEGDSSEGSQPADCSGDQSGQQSADPGQSSDESGKSSQPGGAGSEDQKAQNAAKVREGSAKHAAQDVFGEIKADLQTVAKGNPQQKVMLPPESVTPGSLSEASANELEHKARSTTVSLRKQLMALVEANEKVKKRFLDQGQKVASERISGVAAGDYRVFRRQKRRKKVNTAVHVLLDASSSMDGPRIQIANEASLAIAQALEAIPRVSVAVTAFKGGVESPVYEMLKHNQTARACVGRFAVGASGGTPMAPALWHAARDLCNRREERKIVMVITDGRPAMPEETRNVISLMQRSGYEVVGIGIGTDVVGQFISDYCVIKNVSDLKHSLFDIFRKKLAA